jgi:5-methylcytosine-specific restriction endonuclease McrA
MKQKEWEADHVVPVVLGGAMLGLGNIRTLCRRCHKLETAALAAKRARMRKLSRLRQEVLFTE